CGCSPRAAPRDGGIGLKRRYGAAHHDIASRRPDPPALRAFQKRSGKSCPMTSERDLLAASKAWPITEALKVVERVKRTPPAKGHVLFQTGYGPSGLPHIGTFGEVFRTGLVRQAFMRLSDLPTELFAF